MEIFRKSAFIILIFIVIAGTGCNTKDTGISKPIPDCFDGIKNQGEYGVDCGGPCSFPCPSKMTAYVDGSYWESAGSVTTLVATNVLRIDAGNSTGNISLNHHGPYETGTYALYEAQYENNVTNKTYFSDIGTITFTSWDQAEHIVSGTFSFTAWLNTGAADTVKITQGT